MPAPLAALAATAGIGLAKDLAGDLIKSLAGKGSAGAAQGASSSSAPQSSTQAKARKTANEFEAMFLEQSLNRLTASTGTEGPLGSNGTGGDVYRSMLVKEYAGQITRSGGVGISAQVYGEMMRLQEGAAQGVGGARG